MTIPPKRRAEIDIREEVDIVRIDPLFVERQRNKYASRGVALIVLLNGVAAIVLLGRVEPGLYVAGWIKRGPSGVIGTNKKDATETVGLLLEDAREGRLPGGSGEDLLDLLVERGAEPVLYAGWEAIDATEKAAGEPHGRPRVKLCSWDDLLTAARR